MNIMTPEMIDAMCAHRAAFIADNARRFAKKSERAIQAAWKARLTDAWLNDYAEQRGTLRVIRNYIGIAEAFAQFSAEVQS